MNMGHTHNALQRTVNYGVVIVSRNLERTNENDGFKMTALEFLIQELASTQRCMSETLSNVYSRYWRQLK